MKIKVFFYLKNLGLLNILKLILNRLLSTNYLYVVKVNLKLISQYPLKRVPSGKLSLINNDDLMWIKNRIKRMDSENRREILARIKFNDMGFQNCYVMKNNKEITHMQWLIYPTDNYIIKKYFKRIFYPLNRNQVMIENAFTFPEFRGCGYLLFVSLNLLNIAKRQGYKTAIGYIKKDKINSLNESYKMGFKITQLLRERKFLGYVYRDLKFKELQ